MIPVWTAMTITTICTLAGVAVGVWMAWDRAGADWPDPEDRRAWEQVDDGVMYSADELPTAYGRRR